MRGERGPELAGLVAFEVLGELAGRAVKRAPPSTSMRLAFAETAQLATEYHASGDYLRASLTLQKLAAELLRLQVDDERRPDPLGSTEPAPPEGRLSS
jgi:hypothetical protein